jgi:predicted RNA-binding Zn-ribbon protein involved in translation (DUF1610 family)
MNIGENRMPAGIRQTAAEKLCPECGGKMRETDRCSESAALFIWYQCNRNGCDGQWLEKLPGDYLGERQGC